MARAIDADAIVEEFWKPEYRTQTRRDFIAAIQKWPTLTQLNEPLTLDELRQMDGQPVYVVIDDGLEPLKMWALVDYIEEEMCLILTNNLGGRSEYYDEDNLNQDHITAYRRPPKEETT